MSKFCRKVLLSLIDLNIFIFYFFMNNRVYIMSERMSEKYVWL